MRNVRLRAHDGLRNPAAVSGMARWALFMALALCAAAATAQGPDAAPGESAAEPEVATESPQPSPASPAAATAPFDPDAATEAYLARQTPEEKARSDAYFEGGYWLQLWGLLYGLGIAWVLLASGLSAKMRDVGERFTRFPSVHTAIYALQYTVVGTLLGLPLAIYQGYFREHQYGLSNLTLGGWFTEQGKALAVGLVLGPIAFAVFYAVLRKAPRTWWLWGAVTVVALLAVVIVIAPVYLDPIFNEYRPLDDPEVREPILAMARANGVPAENVWVFDASKQTTRISANVSGFLGTERVRLNDNLLERTSLPEIEAVMGHELGHYVLNHVYEMLLELGLVIVAGFAFVRFAFDPVRRRWGGSWGVRGIADPAGLPLLGALLSVFFFVATPVTNTIIRVNEAEADQFGLNAARQPDGFAEVSLKLGEYRKLEPGPLEEAIFFDHPSGRSRIAMAMRWKAEYLDEAANREPPTTAGGGGTIDP